MIDVINFSSLTPTTIAAACEEAIAACDREVARIVAVPPGERTFANTLAALEHATERVSRASGEYAFMAYVSADDAVRERAREWDERLDKYLVGLSFREDLYAAVRDYAATAEAAGLSGEPARLLEFTLRDYRRNGFDLPPAQRRRVRELFDRLIELGLQFRNAIDDCDDGIVVTREDLAGLPDRYIDGLKRVQVEGSDGYRVSLAYPEFYPFLSNCESEQLRRALFEKEQRKAGLENVHRLEEAIRVRTEIATLLGYDCWASYVVEVKMAKTRQAVTDFLSSLRGKLEEKAAHDMVELRDLKRQHVGSDAVQIWDWRYYHQRLLKTRYAVDEFEVAKYFPLDACLDGMFAITQSVLGIAYEPVPDAPRWHPDVRAFDIYEADGSGPFARFYMDLFPRPNKYGHAAAFTLRRGHVRPDGSYQPPVSAIVANFTKPAGDTPSLLRHSEVETLFHEFGHILHQTLTRTRFARFSGTATERDFVEAPSQMEEHWVWDPDVLQRFARHFESGAPIPEALVKSMIAAKNASSGVISLRQLFFAAFDLAIHSPGFGGDTTAAVVHLHDITGFPYTPGTHFQSGFGHLFGYDAGYYGYLWSRVFGDDMYTRFETCGALSPTVGGEYRRLILERGGSVDGAQMVREFLGREPGTEAFMRELGLTSG